MIPIVEYVGPVPLQYPPGSPGACPCFGPLVFLVMLVSVHAEETASGFESSTVGSKALVTPYSKPGSASESMASLRGAVVTQLLASAVGKCRFNQRGVC